MATKKSRDFEEFTNFRELDGNCLKSVIGCEKLGKLERERKGGMENLERERPGSSSKIRGVQL